MKLTLELLLLILCLSYGCNGSSKEENLSSTDLVVIEEPEKQQVQVKDDTATSLLVPDELTLNGDLLLPDHAAVAASTGADVSLPKESPFSSSDLLMDQLNQLLLPPVQPPLKSILLPRPIGALVKVSKHGQEGFKPLPRQIGSRLKDSFFTSSIVPDLKIAPPSKLLKVQFPNLATVCLGNHLSFIDTMFEPSLNWPSASKRPVVILAGKKKVLHPLYTIVMVDPDVPLFSGQLVHMLKVNVPGAGSRGHTVLQYTPPVPILPAKNKPPSPFVHRFILLVFSQQKLVQPEHAKNYLIGESLHFQLSKFIKAFSLDPVPVAGNFFYGSIYARSKVVC